MCVSDCVKVCVCTWGYHDLVFACSDSQECEIIGWVQITYSSTSLSIQLLNVSSILYSGGIVHGRSDRNT